MDHQFFARLLLLVSSTAGAAIAQLDQLTPEIRRHVVDVEYLGSTALPTRTTFEGTEFGGISGLAYDPRRRVYLALSDDRSQVNPARFYTLDIDVNRNGIAVQIRSVTTLANTAGQPFPARGVDPEGLVRLRDGSLFIASEGEANTQQAPFVNGFMASGRQVLELPIPAHYLPTATAGIRNNLAFESLTATPFEHFLYAGTENALLQDGPVATLASGSPCRILQYRLDTGRAVREFTYLTDPIPVPPVPATAFADNGLVELLATDLFGGMLALERSFASGVGNDIRLYEIRLAGILRHGPIGRSGLVEITEPARKRLVINLGQRGIPVDNIEAMAFGPRLPDGRSLLVLASDNNFNPTQTNLFVALAIRFRGF